MNMNLKSISALIITIVMIFGLSACINRSASGGTGSETTAGNTVLDPLAEVSVVIGSHPSWPYNENWKVWKYFRETVGGKINLIVIPNTEIGTKISLMMASPKSLPDMISADKQQADTYAAQGALIAIDDYIDKMPNYAKFWDSIPEEERNELLMQRKSTDGKTYFPQIYGMERQKNIRSWLYRKDIFEKNGLKTPETLDELYDVASKLKKIYPDSYPICMRDGLRNLKVIGPEWKSYFSYGVYYDFNNKKWCYGATENTMLDIIEYFKKLNSAKLINPDYLTIKPKAWEELISTNRGFIMPEYQTRISFFHAAARANNPKFTLDVMLPPKANSVSGQNMIAKFNVDPTGYMICNTGNQKRIDNVIKIIDWMYSDKGCELLSWGKAGETYKEVNGEKQFITDDAKTGANLLYGFQTIGTYLRIDPKAADAIAPQEQSSTTDFALKYTENHYNPVNWVALNPDEKKIADDIGTSLTNYVDEMLSKFLLGQEPMSNWDAFQKQIKDMGVDELLNAYTTAYNRVIKEQ